MEIGTGADFGFETETDYGGSQVKVFYNPRMSTPSHGHSPSGTKPEAVVKDWEQRGLDIQIVDFEPATPVDLNSAHQLKYVTKVLTYEINNGHGNKIESVTDSCLWTVGSMVAAARAALTEGITCSPSSGFHHAGYAHNAGYCTFNGLIVAAQCLRKEGLIEKVGIIDCDAHYGDGTDDIIRTCGLKDNIHHWTFGREYGGRRKSYDFEPLLDRIRIELTSMKSAGVEVILYQAGADPHINDPLGGYMLSMEMRLRDKYVFAMCDKLRLPVAWNLAGGYQQEPDGSIPKVLDLHRATAEEAIAVLNERSLDIPKPVGGVV